MPSELHKAGFTLKQLREAKFDAHQMKESAFSVQQLADAGFPASRLKRAFPYDEMRAAGFSHSESIP